MMPYPSILYLNQHTNPHIDDHARHGILVSAKADGHQRGRVLDGVVLRVAALHILRGLQRLPAGAQGRGVAAQPVLLARVLLEPAPAHGPVQRRSAQRRAQPAPHRAQRGRQHGPSVRAVQLRRGRGHAVQCRVASAPGHSGRAAHGPVVDSSHRARGGARRAPVAEVLSAAAASEASLMLGGIGGGIGVEMV